VLPVLAPTAALHGADAGDPVAPPKLPSLTAASIAAITSTSSSRRTPSTL
jgi:hypothetical protein